MPSFREQNYVANVRAALKAKGAKPEFSMLERARMLDHMRMNYPPQVSRNLLMADRDGCEFAIEADTPEDLRDILVRQLHAGLTLTTSSPANRSDVTGAANMLKQLIDIWEAVKIVPKPAGPPAAKKVTRRAK